MTWRCSGEQRTAVGYCKTSESKRERSSANMGTREPRPSMVVAQLIWFSDQPKPLPMRQPRGGAPVVVGDVNDVHMAKGCRMIRGWRTEAFGKSGGFQMNTGGLQRRLVRA